MDDRFLTWDDFVDGFGREMRFASEVHERMVEGGLKDNALSRFDFTFVSDSEEKLRRLGDFLQRRYGCSIAGIEEVDEAFELNGETGDIAVTADNLMYWALDMAKRGYEFDAKFEAYGAPFHPDEQRFPDLAPANEDFWFDQAVELYEAGNLSGALIAWSNVLAINAKNVDALYSRAIVKSELYTWKAALRDYDAAIDIAPDFFSARVNRGSLKADHGDHAGAFEDYERVIRDAPEGDHNRPLAYFNRGNSKLALSDNAGACADWLKARELGADYAQQRIDEHCKG
jgi:tetratricopeptide (TPR) repeat protein